MNQSIEFFCYENDKPVEVQLEPDAIIFTAYPNKDLRIVAVNCQEDFKWSIRIDPEGEGLQLFPESKGTFQIEIYQNGERLDYFYG